MKLSVVIPAHNEAAALPETIGALARGLATANLDYEILVVNDHSSDATESVLRELECEWPRLRYVNNTGRGGFGLAVRCGLENFRGDAVAIYMADASDRPEDLVAFYKTMIDEGVDCVFGSRFIAGGQVIDYPGLKLFLNRLANQFIRVLFRLPYNDMTNAFKLYRRSVIEGVQPILSHHFNLTVELPLKAIIRGYTYAVVPNVWIGRKTGESKLKIQEMGSRYLFIVLYCLLEKWLSKGDSFEERFSATISICAPSNFQAGGSCR
jgi:dolichol-phosphate mannosyltransferase